MRTIKRGVLPPRLETLRRRFKQWRRTRTIGSRIPESLWTAAAKLAEAHGVNPTAKALAIDYYSLKQRVEEKSVSCSRMVAAANGGGRFVELAATARMGIPECVLELEDIEGAQMRIHLKGIEPADLVALSRSLWRVD